MALCTAALVTLVPLASVVVLTVGRADIQTWVVDTSVVPGTHIGERYLQLANLLQGLGALLFALAFCATGWWLVELRRVAEWYAPASPQQRSSVWAVLGWIVPIVNLWFPYQVVADSSRALRSRVRSFWPWWIAWLLVGAGSYADRSQTLLASAADVDSWVLSQQINVVILVVALALWWRVVRSATTAATAAVEEVRVTS